MAKITYLLGAGASCGALPVVSDFRQRIKELAEGLKTYTREQLNEEAFATLPHFLREKNQVLGKMICDFNWLLEQSEYHQTIDTLAKRFYLAKKSDDLRRLKQTLILFFTIEQMFIYTSPFRAPVTRKGIDKRYDGFIATLANPDIMGIKLADNVKVLTWNYDLQFELGIKRFVQLSINEIKREFQIFPNHNTNRDQIPAKFDINRFAFVKINGNAVWNSSDERGIDIQNTLYDKYFESKDEKGFLSELIEEYDSRFNKTGREIEKATQYFNFAWESNKEFKDKYEGHQNNLETAIEIAKKTDVLVVIGYSFPVFNREIDKLVFDNMNKIKKVYVQDKDPEKVQSTMKNAFKVFEPRLNAYEVEDELPFFLEDNVDQFFIPYEL